MESAGEPLFVAQADVECCFYQCELPVNLQFLLPLMSQAAFNPYGCFLLMESGSKNQVQPPTPGIPSSLREEVDQVCRRSVGARAGCGWKDDQ